MRRIYNFSKTLNLDRRISVLCVINNFNGSFRFNIN